LRQFNKLKNKNAENKNTNNVMIENNVKEEEIDTNHIILNEKRNENNFNIKTNKNM
jgi:hypothetical protein